jgi:peptide chain release factor subunit 1
MLTPEDIEQLEAFDGRGARVLSTYLDLDPERQRRHAYRIAFEDLVKATRETLEEPAREELSREVVAVQAWLASEKPAGKGLALFSCTARGLWQVQVLHVRVRDHLTFEPKPDVAPLLELLDEHERYAVALVDKEKARVFTVFMGEIQDREVLKDDVPGKHDQGGASQAHHQRHHELHVHWHVKRVAQRLADLLRRRRFDRLILSGPEEATTALRGLLPDALARRVVAVVPGKMTASDAEVLSTTLEVEREVEREAEEHVLTQLLDTAGPGGQATLGVVATLDALWADVVQTLVVAHDVHQRGSECANCGRLEPGSVAACPACGTRMSPVHDLFHRAMARALEQAGRVEVVHGATARRLLDTGGGLGALLRYASPAARESATTPSDTGVCRRWGRGRRSSSSCCSCSPSTSASSTARPG